MWEVWLQIQTLNQGGVLRGQGSVMLASFSLTYLLVLWSSPTSPDKPHILTRTEGTLVEDKRYPAVFYNWERLLPHSSGFSRLQESLA